MFRMYILCILICLYMWNYDCSMSLTCPLPPKDSLCIGYPFAMLPAPHFPRQPFIYFLSIEIRLHFLEFYGNEIISIYLIWLCKESTCQCRRHKRCRFNPWVRKIPWSRKWQTTPVFLPGKFHGQRSLTGYSPWGWKELDTTEQWHPSCAWDYGLSITRIILQFIHVIYVHSFLLLNSMYIS